MDATGNSDSWLAQKRNVVSVFEKFKSQLTPELRATLNLSQPFDKTDSDSLQNRKIYENFALFLAEDYIIEKGASKGEHLRPKPAVNLLNGIVQAAHEKSRINETAESRLFFLCRDPNGTTPEALWLKGLRRNLGGAIYQRMKKQGEQMDISATPIYADMIAACIRALAREDTAEAAKRRMTLRSLWLATGRSSEVAWNTFDSMSIDGFFDMAHNEGYQEKIAQTKLIAYPAGRQRDMCYYLDMADFLHHTKHVYDPEGFNFIFTDFGTSVSSVQPRSFAKRRTLLRIWRTATLSLFISSSSVSRSRFAIL